MPFYRLEHVDKRLGSAFITKITSTLLGAFNPVLSASCAVMGK